MRVGISLWRRPAGDSVSAMWVVNGVLVCAALLPLVAGWTGPLRLPPPARGHQRTARPPSPAVYGVQLTSSRKWHFHPDRDQQQLNPLKQESIVIPDGAAQAAAEDAEEAQTATNREDVLQLVEYSFINAPDRPCPNGQYRDAQGVCRDAW